MCTYVCWGGGGGGDKTLHYYRAIKQNNGGSACVIYHFKNSVCRDLDVQTVDHSLKLILLRVGHGGKHVSWFNPPTHPPPHTHAHIHTHCRHCIKTISRVFLFSCFLSSNTLVTVAYKWKTSLLVFLLLMHAVLSCGNCCAVALS